MSASSTDHGGETAGFGHEAKLARLGLHPLADDGGCALTLLDGQAWAATAHIPKFRNKQRPEAAPSPLN